MIALAIIDGSRRLRNGSFRSLRHPHTMSRFCCSHISIMPGMSVGSFWLSPSAVTMYRPRACESGRETRGLTEIAPEANHSKTRVPALQTRQLLERIVRTAVVYRDDLVRPPEAGQARRQLAVEPLDIRRLVPHRNDDGDLRGHLEVNA